MRRKYQPAAPAKKKKKEGPEYHCRDCTRMIEPHSIDYKGDPILCRCKFYENGKYSKFLKDPACEHFILKS